MTITLPDDPALCSLDSSDIRTDLACGAYSAGHVSRAVAARMAGMPLEKFDRILAQRKISIFSQESLEEDLQALRNFDRA
jgi:predicted HTH domain antitoxin